MNVRNIDLNLLYVFIIVYEKKSITQAAESLHLTQPAVSNALQRLKTALNQTLFVNKNRKIFPTRMADNLYDDIRPCFKKIELSLAQLSGFHPQNSERTFQIATNNCGDLALFPKLIPYLQQQAPNVKINRKECPDKDFNRQILQGDLDLVLFFDFPVEDGVTKEFLFKDSMVLVTGLSYPGLSAKPTIQELLEIDIIGHGDGYDQYVPLLAQIKQQKGYQHPRLEMENIWSILNVVVMTNLAAVIPGFFAKKAAKFMPIKIYKLASVDEELNVFLYWRDIEKNDKGHQWFRELVREIILTEISAS